MEKICWKGHGAMFGANVMWGLMSPVAKAVLLGGVVSPFVLAGMRVFGAMVLFWLLSFFRRPEHVHHKDLLALFGASLLAIVFNQCSFILGVGMTSPVNASIITTSMPLLAMVLAAFILKEPVTGKKVLGIAFGAAGALLLIMGSQGSSPSATEGPAALWGDLLVLSAQFCYALYIVLYKDFVSKYSLVTIMKWMFTYAFICMLPFSYQDLLSTDWAAVTAGMWGDIAFVVFCGTFLSYCFVVVGQKALRPTVAGMYNYVQPVVAAVLAVCWGMESFQWSKVCSVILIFFGVYLVTASRSRAELERYEAGEKEKTRTGGTSS